MVYKTLHSCSNTSTHLLAQAHTHIYTPVPAAGTTWGSVSPKACQRVVHVPLALWFMDSPLHLLTATAMPVVHLNNKKSFWAAAGSVD